MSAFVVRPFGVKDGIDFERVHAELIVPALEAVHLEGNTTDVMARAGNIRVDMFELLLLADIVIADISIHNANVYYELGVRHALRDRHTILIHSARHDVPFDLRTDRYLPYDAADPGASVPALVAALQQTLHAGTVDSPVYLLLPDLPRHDAATFKPVPPLFLEAVNRARRDADRARLGLLGEELEELDWQLSGLRYVGRAQFELGAWQAARTTWEAIRKRRPDDTEANFRLGTVYQRLGELSASSAALERLLRNDLLDAHERGEAQSLVGRNLKTQWLRTWIDLPLERRAAEALRSPLLDECLSAYHAGFLEDQNHFYSGVNALALLTVLVQLARREPEVWAERFASDEDAAAALKRHEADLQILTGAVRHCLDAASRRGERERRYDVWLDVTRADYALLTSTRPAFVANHYVAARARLAEHEGSGAAFPTESAARQIRIYLALGILVDNARAALHGLRVPVTADPLPAAPAVRPRVVVFTGHRIDPPARLVARFPAAAESLARAAIRAALAAEVASATGPGNVLGIACGASGGDILFHELCQELAIPSTLLLALPRSDYAAHSVQDADGGGGWMDRFQSLCARTRPVILGDSPELPPWLHDRRDYGLWERNLLWTVHTALAHEEADVTLIALWDRAAGDGPGGTAAMVEMAQRRGIKVVVLDTRELFADLLSPLFDGLDDGRVRAPYCGDTVKVS